MAVTSHRRVSRKALKQPDEFVTSFDWIADVVGRHLARVVIGVAAIVAASAIVLVVSLYSQQRQRIVSAQFYRAINALGDKDYKTAEEDFGALARNDSSRSLGRLARFYLATTYLTQNKTSKARDALRDYLADPNNRLFRQMALTQLGVTEEDLGDNREAHAAYVKAASLNGPEKARAQIGAARTLALLGDHQAAIAAYQRFLRDNPFAQQRSEVIEALAQMGSPLEPTVKQIGSPAAARTPGH
jgi:tetratricopeptide (TPR) repeat protein